MAGDEDEVLVVSRGLGEVQSGVWWFGSLVVWGVFWWWRGVGWEGKTQSVPKKLLIRLLCRGRAVPPRKRRGGTTIGRPPTSLSCLLVSRSDDPPESAPLGASEEYGFVPPPRPRAAPLPFGMKGRHGRGDRNARKSLRTMRGNMNKRTTYCSSSREDHRFSVAYAGRAPHCQAVDFHVCGGIDHSRENTLRLGRAAQRWFPCITRGRISMYLLRCARGGRERIRLRGVWRGHCTGEQAGQRNPHRHSKAGNGRGNREKWRHCAVARATGGLVYDRVG